MNKKEVYIYIHDFSDYINIIDDLKPMLKKNCSVFIEKKPVESMSGGISNNYYLHIVKKEL